MILVRIYNHALHTIEATYWCAIKKETCSLQVPSGDHKCVYSKAPHKIRVVNGRVENSHVVVPNLEIVAWLGRQSTTASKAPSWSGLPAPSLVEQDQESNLTPEVIFNAKVGDKFKTRVRPAEEFSVPSPPPAESTKPFYVRDQPGGATSSEPPADPGSCPLCSAQPERPSPLARRVERVMTNPFGAALLAWIAGLVTLGVLL